MIKAKVTIFDDETGRIYELDKVSVPVRIETVDLDIESSFVIKEYIFQFGEKIMTTKGEDNGPGENVTD